MQKSIGMSCALVLATGCLADNQVHYRVETYYNPKQCNYIRKTAANCDMTLSARDLAQQAESPAETALYKAISKLDTDAIARTSFDVGAQRISLLTVLKKFDQALGRKLRMNSFRTALAGIVGLGLMGGMGYLLNKNPNQTYGTTKLAYGLGGIVGAGCLACGLDASVNAYRSLMWRAGDILNNYLLRKGAFVEGADAAEIERVLASIAKKLK